MLAESDRDFVLKATLAASLQSPEHEVGRCLKALVEEGLLMTLCLIEPLDKDGDPVTVKHGTETVHWDGKRTAWVKTVWRPRKVSRVTRRPRFGVSEPADEPYELWDGKGHYVLRGTDVFKRACRAVGLPEDPVNDPWTCGDCGAHNHGQSNRASCKRCHKPRSKADADAGKPAEPQCPRCGGPLHFKRVQGKKRIDIRKCNVEIVRSVIES